LDISGARVRIHGGFFELAEAYLNFGLLGCLAVPFAISFLMGICYRKALAGSLFWFMILGAVLAVFFRGAWYQTFSYYKATLTGTALFLLIILVKDIFRWHGISLNYSRTEHRRNSS
ncbi:MAG TPA: hypothetical protein VEF92_10290, partial [Burkholderiales bacterium]|nr:hypothetical protein [Burkholderiales bacterium]